MPAEVFIRTSALPGAPDCFRRAAAGLFPDIIRAMGYELREMPQGIGASVGQGLHAGAAQMMTHKLEHGETGPEGESIDVAIEAFREVIQGGVIYDDTTPIANIAEKQIARGVHTYREQVAPKIIPLMIEQQLEAEVRPGLVLTGRPDVVAMEKGKIRDTKGGRMLGNYNAQAGGYALLVRSDGTDIVEACIDFIKRSSVKKPPPDAIEIPINLAAAETAAIRILDHIVAGLEIFMNGDAKRRFLPGDPWAWSANPNSKLCSPKWCKCFGTSFCHEGSTATGEKE